MSIVVGFTELLVMTSKLHLSRMERQTQILPSAIQVTVLV